MNSRSIAVGIAGSLALVGLPLFASPAVAAADTSKPVIKSGSAMNEVYALKPDETQQVTVKVRVTDNVGVTRVDGLLYAPGKTGSSDAPKYGVRLSRVSGTAKDGVWQGSVPVKLGVPRGSWALKAKARDAADNRTGTSVILDRFSIKSATMLEHWQVEQVRSGKVNLAVGIGTPLFLEGVWQWGEFKDQKIVIEFRKKGSTTWVAQGSPPGIDGGIHYGEMKSPGDGDWRARYYGTSKHAGKVTKAIYVDMK